MRPANLDMAIEVLMRSGLFGSKLRLLRHPDQYKAAVVYAICRHLKPEVVVETGVASGISSTGILLGLADNGRGHLYSIDLPEAEYARDNGAKWKDALDGRETGWAVPRSLRSRWSLLLGSSRELLPELVRKVERIGIFYHDSEHTAANMMFEFETVFEHLVNEGVLLADNVNWNMAFSDFCLAHGLRHSVVFPYLGVAVRPTNSRTQTNRP
jgi:hypothetical protein